MRFTRDGVSVTPFRPEALIAAANLHNRAAHLYYIHRSGHPLALLHIYSFHA